MSHQQRIRYSMIWKLSSFGSATRKSTRKLESQFTQICELRKLEFWERSIIFLRYDLDTNIQTFCDDTTRPKTTSFLFLATAYSLYPYLTHWIQYPYYSNMRLFNVKKNKRARWDRHSRTPWPILILLVGLPVLVLQSHNLYQPASQPAIRRQSTDKQEYLTQQSQQLSQSALPNASSSSSSQSILDRSLFSANPNPTLYNGFVNQMTAVRQQGDSSDATAVLRNINDSSILQLS